MAVKRTKSSNERATKRHKPSMMIEDIEQIQEKIISSAKNYNKIVDLVEALGNKSLVDVHATIATGLLKIFGTLSKSGAMSNKANAEKHNAVVAWLCERYEEYKTWLAASLRSNEGDNTQNLAPLAYSIFMKLVMIEYKYLERDPLDTVQSLVQAAVESPDTAEDLIINLLAQDDLRYYTLKSVGSICRLANSTSDSTGIQAVELLLLVDKFPKKEEEISDFFFENPPGDVKSLKAHRKAFQDAWLQALRFVKTEAQYKAVLQSIHQKIIPNFLQPQMLLDFLTDCYDVGGSIALLALHGLFILIQHHNLDYPHFYTKLYNLFDGNVLHATYRSRLFRLVDLFLSSTHLPVAVMASFIKKIARLSLFAPPAAIVAVIPFIYNQLKRHPVCMVMIHREDSEQSSDPFNENEPDPLLTNALDSSLWELDTLTAHYHPNVAALAKIFSQPFRKPQYALEDFLDHSYRTLAASEKKRKLKAAPALEYEEFDGFGGYMNEWAF